MRVSTLDDFPGIRRMLYGVFHGTDDETEELTRAVVEPERGLVVTDGDEIVAHAAAYSRDLTVPGDVIPAAHVTAVGVAATHRRRRLLTGMMRRQLRDVHDAHREPIAVLWASESAIYPRFGYGLAAQRLVMEIDSRDAGIDPAPDTRLRAAEPPALLTELTKVYEQLRPSRPGWSSRDERWWSYVLADPPASRAGGTALRAVVHETESGADGYAIWRTKAERAGEVPRAARCG
jgi:predicted acetyltransferase